MSERAKVNHSEQYKRTNRTKLATHIYSVRIIINNIYIIYYYSKGKYMYVDKLLFVRMFVLVGMKRQTATQQHYLYNRTSSPGNLRI